MICHITAFLLGVILDQVIGDPHSAPHPVRALGKLIHLLEDRLLGKETDDRIRDPAGERKKGMLLWITVALTTALVSSAVILAAYRLGKYAGVIVEAVMTLYILSARSLYRESMAVAARLEANDIEGARKALSMIVGRDTENLDEEEVIKAAVETVAENTSDGVTAPLIFTALGGPVAGFVYKAVNTMDSMLGYRNERYEHFGFFAACADDVFNFIPSRLSALAMISGCMILGAFSRDYSAGNAYRIWRRDRHNHSSPNSAQTESVCAGALGLRLGGTHLYRGIAVEKPVIGDEIRKPRIPDIKRANALMLMTEGITTAVIILISSIIIILGKH